MNIKSLIAMSLVALCLAPTVSFAAAKQLPVEDFFRQPEKVQYTISPDGKHFAWLEPWKEGENRLNIMVSSVEDPTKGKRITDRTDRDIPGYGWVNNNQLVYLADQGGDENYHLWLKDFNTEAPAVDVTPFDKVRAGIVDLLDDDDDHILITLNKDNPQVFDIYKLNLKTHELTLEAKNPGNVVGWATDHDGVVRVAYVSDGLNMDVLYRDTKDEEFKPLISSSFEDTNEFAGFTADNKKIYLISDEGRDDTALYEFDPHTKDKTLLFENKDSWGGVSGILWSDARKVLTGARWIAEKPERHYFDDEAKKIYEDLQKLQPEKSVSIVDVSKDETKYIVAYYSDRDPGTYYYYDKANPGELKLLAQLYPWLPTEEMAEMKPITYEARDGLLIRGYLTIPKDSDGKNLPLVVNPHGGPEARDVWGYNPEVQMLANRGVAVFQPNFRISTGMGKAFWKAGFKQWGQAMQDDITDGVQYLIDQGIADPKRVAIYGASYGGYATLMGLIKTPDLYAAGVDYVGVSDLTTLLASVPEYWKPMLDQMKATIGDPEKDAAMLKEYSPIYNAEKITKPLFIAQGANDPRVIKKQSDDMVAAMKARGVEVEYMVKDNEGHGFHNEENRMEFYKAMLAFLENHLGLKAQ